MLPPSLPSRRSLCLAASALFMSGAALAQSPTELANQLSLSARAFRDVPEDWLTMTVRASVDAPDALSVQHQLKVALEAALGQLRPQTQPQVLEVSTGGFGIEPRHNNRGRVIGWQGSAELVIEGRDFSRISAAAGKVSGMTVVSAGFSLSHEARHKLESEVQALAVERFRQRAHELSRHLGFTGYTLRQVSVTSADQDDPVTAYRAMAAEDGMAVPVEAGKVRVNITVSGTVQMR